MVISTSEGKLSVHACALHHFTSNKNSAKDTVGWVGGWGVPYKSFLTYVKVVGERFWCIFETSWCHGAILPFQCLSCKPSFFQSLNGPTHTVQWYPVVEGRLSIKT